MLVYVPKKGFIDNPLLKNIKRNNPCPCNSGKKFKKCCLNLIQQYIPEYLKNEMINKTKEEQYKIYCKYVIDYNKTKQLTSSHS